jgi:hypothetical protein
VALVPLAQRDGGPLVGYDASCALWSWAPGHAPAPLGRGDALGFLAEQLAEATAPGSTRRPCRRSPARRGGSERPK